MGRSWATGAAHHPVQPPDEAVARTREPGLSGALGSRFRSNIGELELEISFEFEVISLSGAQPAASCLVRSFKRLWTAQMKRHSLVTAWRPRPEKRLQRRFALMLPKTGSTVILRMA